MTLNPNWYLNATGQFQQIGSGQIGISTTTSTAFLTSVSNFTVADISITNTSYTDGPSVAQGTTGVWYASGSITFTDGVGAANVSGILWDGQTIVASGNVNINAATAMRTMSLSGIFTNPSTNIKISALNQTRAAGLLKNTVSGSSRDCSLYAFRIG